MKTLKNRVAVVTGAASGIGRALATRLAQEGAHLALADVNEAGLAETAAMVTGVNVTTHRVDVSKEAEVIAFAKDVQARHGGANVLINNAGVGLHGLFEELTNRDLEWLMGINFWGVVYGTRAFLPMLLADEGHLVNLSSVFGIVAPAGQTAYCAAKFAVRGFSEALRHEYAGSKLRVTVVHPGGIKTNIANTSRVPEGFDPAEAKRRAELFNKVAARTSAESAADVIVRGILANRPRVLIGADAKLLDRVARWAPERYWGLLGKVMDPKGWYRSRKAARA